VSHLRGVLRVSNSNPESNKLARDPLNLIGFAETCSQFLVDLNEKVVLAESCTGGLVASTLASIPGISNYLCGSFVTYRASSKRSWLGVKKSTIKSFSTESLQVVEEMAIGALKITPEANWGLSIVGHLGPDAPQEKDGVVWICIARRTRKGKIKVKSVTSHKLNGTERVPRQRAAAEIALTLLSRTLVTRQQVKDGHSA